MSAVDAYVIHLECEAGVCEEWSGGMVGLRFSGEKWSCQSERRLIYCRNRLVGAIIGCMVWESVDPVCARSRERGTFRLRCSGQEWSELRLIHCHIQVNDSNCRMYGVELQAELNRRGCHMTPILARGSSKSADCNLPSAHGNGRIRRALGCGLGGVQVCLGWG